MTDGWGVEALAGPPPAPRPWRRFALRAGAVFGFAAGAWLLGSFAASAATPDPTPPTLVGGALTSVDDAAEFLVTPIAPAAQGADVPIAEPGKAIPGEGATARNQDTTPVAVAASTARRAVDTAAHTATRVLRVAAPPTTGRSGNDAAGPAATSPSSRHGGAARTDTSATPVKTSALPAARSTMAVSAAESAIATVVRQVRGVTSSIGPADHAARTLTAPVTEAIHAAVAPVSESLPLTRVADALGAALAPVQDTLRLPAEVRAPRVVTALTPLIDDGPWASAGAPVADAPARQDGGSAGMTLGIVGGSDRAAVLPEGHFGAWSPTLSLASEAHAQDVAGSGARTGQHTVPTERSQRVTPPLVVGAADPAPVPEAPAPFPTPPAVAPAAGAASATNNGHGCVATAIRARVTVPEPSTAVDAGVVPAVLDQAQDPGFSPG